MNRETKGQMKGQITVFASLVIVLVMSVVCASIKSVSMSVAKTNANVACNLSVESLFAEYSKPLLDEFDILFLKKSDQLESKLKTYIEENIKYSTGFTSEKLQSVKVNEIVMAIDNGGTVIKQQILDYMDYGILSEAAQMIIGSEEKVKKSEKTKEIVDKISKCEDDTREIDSIVLQLISKVDGVDTNENGFKTKHNRPLAVEDDFVKEMCIGEINNKNTAVYNAKVYDVLSSKYINVLDILTDMHLEAELIIEDGDEESDLYGINSYDSIFLRNYNQLNNLLNSVTERMQEAITIAERYGGMLEKVTNEVNNIKFDVETNRTTLGDELADSFGEDLSDFKNFDYAQTKSICDVNNILSALKSNLGVLNNTKQIFNSINSELSKKNAQRAIDTIDRCVDIISQYDNTKLVFDYSGVDFSSNSTGLGTIKNIISTIESGIVGLVIPDNSTISQKSIDYSDLASSQQNGRSSYWSNITEEAKDNMLYNEYLFSKFNSFSDSFVSNGNVIETNDLLDYKLEYILCGNKSDFENLKSTILQLSLIREGTNLEYLFTDSEKKYQSYTLALSLLGFTGNYAAIKAGQYLIMSAWAYGETIVDLRKLCSGEKVELTKNRSNWNLNLDNLLAMELTSDSNPDKDKGFNYEEYLRILLYMENPTSKYFQTMDAMEMKMIEKSYKDFRLKDYIYSLNATAVFSINRKTNYYSQEMQYKY